MTQHPKTIDKPRLAQTTAKTKNNKRNHLPKLSFDVSAAV